MPKDPSKGALLYLARLNSSRLPGKQLMPVIDNITVLDLLLLRMKNSRFNLPAIMTTTENPIDDPLSEFAINHNMLLFRGESDNVARRCLDCMVQYDLDWFVRICADSPLMDPEVVDLVLDEFLSNDSDLTTNVFIHHDFPFGCSVEIITRDAMKRICEATDDLAILEHVTAYAYQHPDNFKIKSVRSQEKFTGDVQAITVDTPQDLEKAKWIVSKLADPASATLKEIVPLAKEWQENQIHEN